MVHILAIVLVAVICLMGANGVPGTRVRRGFSSSGYGGERGGGSVGGGGGGYYNSGSDERDASVSRENGGCSGENDKFSAESGESTYGRDGYHSGNERRHEIRPR